jgi:4-hydroxy-tetrahydrodipicolinate synthase
MLPKTVLRLQMIFKILLLLKKQLGYGSMQIVKDKPKDFLVISGDDMIALPMVLAGVQGHIRYRAGFSKGVL